MYWVKSEDILLQNYIIFEEGPIPTNMANTWCSINYWV